MRWQDHITQDPSILLGKPVIGGTRISVELLLELLKSGWTRERIFESYPHLPKDTIEIVKAHSAL